jgi:hypothetical protein
MAISQSLATSFKVQLMQGTQNFSSNTFKMALYTSAATLGPGTTAYTTSNEVSGTGYTAGGNTLTVSVAPTSSGTTAFVSFSNTSWTSASFTARGAMIYNSTNGNACVAVFDFGADKTVVDGTFTITFPTADATTAIIRIA